MKKSNFSLLLRLLAWASACGAAAAVIAWKWEKIEASLKGARKLYIHEHLLKGFRYRRALREEYKDYADVDADSVWL